MYLEFKVINCCYENNEINKKNIPIQQVQVYSQVKSFQCIYNLVHTCTCTGKHMKVNTKHVQNSNVLDIKQ